MEIIGKVVRLGNLTEGTSARGPWRKQELIIETEEQYPRTVCLICWTNQIEEFQPFEWLWILNCKGKHHFGFGKRFS